MESNSNKLGSRHSRAFNAAIEDYNLRCSNYQYYEDDNKAIDADIALRLPHLVIEGNDLERLVRWHQQLLWHVTVEILNLRDAPSTSGAVISRLDKYKDVIRTGSPREGWLPVRVGELTGYASLHYLSRGSGAETKRLECLAAAGTSPTSGEILAGSLNGPNMIHVSNGLKADALFKLKRRDRSTALSFFVEAGDDVEIQHIADGDYQLTFATGLNFNRSWNRFCSKPSRPRAFESYEPFKSTATSYTSVELTLHPIPSGNSAAREVDEQEEYFFWED